MKFNLFKDIELTLKKRRGTESRDMTHNQGRVDRGEASCHGLAQSYCSRMQH